MSRIGTSVRLELLLEAQRLSKELGFSVPRLVIIPPGRFPENIHYPELTHLAESFRSELMHLTRDFIEERVFVRSAPFDEALRPDLSFAGVYKSYAPKRYTPKDIHLVNGLMEVLAGRFNPYADYYYERHQIRAKREIGVQFMELVPRYLLRGTAYVFDGRLLTEFYDSQLSVQLEDPVRLAVTQASKSRCGYEEMANVFFTLSSALERGLDVEYLVDVAGQVHVVQVRPLSAVHLRNWKLLWSQVFETYTLSTPPAVVLNSIGNKEGVMVDLRGRKLCPEDFSGGIAEKIFLIHHHSSTSGTSSFEFLKYLNDHQIQGVSLIVIHGTWRVLDHLQYALVEDPGISFVIQTTLPETIQDFCDGQQVRLTSDGFEWQKQDK